MIFESIKQQLEKLVISKEYIDAYENYYFSSNPNLENEYVNKFKTLDSLKEIYKHNNPKIFRDFYVITANDIEILIVLIVHYYNYLKEHKSDKEPNVLEEVKYIADIYIPIAARLGFYSIKSEMEDLSFFILKNDEYKKIAKLLNEKKKDRDITINDMVCKIKNIIDNDNFEIYGRSKHIYSIYNKINDKEKDINTIFDLFAIRIIVPTINDCYFVLGEINESFEPLKNRFKDYIAKPKANSYQSIHTVIRNDKEQIFEIQIRTKQMHKDAELGVAAHFSYKEKAKMSYTDNTLLTYRDSKKYIPNDNLYAITPLHKLIHLQRGDTIIDYAFLIHTEVGNKMVGAVVNDEIKTLNYIIQNGDVIKILTKKNASGPSLEWIDMCNSQTTKRKIKTFIKRKELAVSEIALKEGFKVLSKDLSKCSINPTVLSESKIINKLIRELNYDHINYLYSDIYDKKLKTSDVINILSVQKEKNSDIKLVNLIKNNFKDDVEVLGAYGVKTDIAKCCHPIFGDEIVAIVKQGDSFKIHKKDCKQIDINKAVSAIWNIQKTNDTKYLCSVRLIVDNQSTSQVLAAFAKDKIEIVKLTTSDVGDYKVMNMNIYLKTVEQFIEVKSNITKDKYVIAFDRV